MDANNGAPVLLAEALEKLLSPIHDKYMLAAAARLYPKTIQNIIMRRPVSQVTLSKVSRALYRGELSPRGCPPDDPPTLSARLHHFVTVAGGTAHAAAALGVDPLVVAKLIYERPVNERFRSLVIRRLEKAAYSRPAREGVPHETVLNGAAEDSLAQCRQAYEMYKVHGTLEAVGRQLHLSRERVRQLINRGVAYGVIPATPHYTEASHPFPFASRDEFLAAYRTTPSLRRLVQDWHISKERLKRFCRQHGVRPGDLERIRRAAREAAHAQPISASVPNIAVNM